MKIVYFSNSTFIALVHAWKLCRIDSQINGMFIQDLVFVLFWVEYQFRDWKFCWVTHRAKVTSELCLIPKFFSEKNSQGSWNMKRYWFVSCVLLQKHQIIDQISQNIIHTLSFRIQSKNNIITIIFKSEICYILRHSA
jgi:hypothetical protein